jgi:uncharacterized membrane protein YcgQ (UPF0703/DUF1980 family)
MEYPSPMITISLSEYLSLKDNINTEKINKDDYFELLEIIKNYINEYNRFIDGSGFIPENPEMFIKKIMNTYYIKKNK